MNVRVFITNATTAQDRELIDFNISVLCHATTNCWMWDNEGLIVDFPLSDPHAPSNFLTFTRYSINKYGTLTVDLSKKSPTVALPPDDVRVVLEASTDSSTEAVPDIWFSSPESSLSEPDYTPESVLNFDFNEPNQRAENTRETRRRLF